MKKRRNKKPVESPGDIRVSHHFFQTISRRTRATESTRRLTSSELGPDDEGQHDEEKEKDNRSGVRSAGPTHHSDTYSVLNRGPTNEKWEETNDPPFSLPLLGDPTSFLN